MFFIFNNPFLAIHISPNGNSDSNNFGIDRFPERLIETFEEDFFIILDSRLPYFQISLAGLL